MGLTNGFPCTKVNWLQLLLSARSAKNRDKHWPSNMIRFPGMTFQLPGNRLTILADFQCGKAIALNLLESLLILLMYLPCLHVMILTNLPYRNSECLIYCYNILHRIAPDREAEFIGQEVWQLVYSQGSHWSYYIVHHSQTVDFTER